MLAIATLDCRPPDMRPGTSLKRVSRPICPRRNPVCLLVILQNIAVNMGAKNPIQFQQRPLRTAQAANANKAALHFKSSTVSGVPELGKPFVNNAIVADVLV